MSALIPHLSILQSHVFLINSRLGSFSAPYLHRDPFSRSYVVNLPSSLAMNHSSTLGFSPRLPVSVYGTGSHNLKLSGFSWKSDYSDYPFIRRLRVLSGSTFCTDLPIQNISTPLNVLFRQYAHLSLLRHRIEYNLSIGILTNWPSASSSLQ